MKRDFIGKTVFLVAFVAILVVSVYGFSGKMMQERHDAQNKTSETTSDKQTDNNGLKTTGKTTEITTEKTTEPEEKDERKLPKATDKLVCFTFDDGPYAPVTNKILDTLEKYNGRATFFVVGDRADTYSDEIIRASKMGCEIGTHTYSHVNLNSLSVPEMQEEIKKSCDAISKYTGKKVKVLRPPEGAANDTVKANVGMPMVLWSVDSRDWDYRNADKDYQTVMDNVFDGSIVLMHDLYPATADAVARLIPELAKQGYKFVTFSELMKIRGVDVEPGEKYFSATPQAPAEECDNAG
jgi:peptidoglycan/xylan/chitin deacetylase (PgdA/CDA1 family)